MKGKNERRLGPVGPEAMQPALEPSGETIPPLGELPEMADTMRFLDTVRRLPAIRFDKVQRMKELISADQLETPERIDGAIKRLLEDLNQ